MRKFNEGEIVEIIDGPYKGVIGKIDGIVEFDPGVVGLYLIKTKEGSTIKIIDSEQLRSAGAILRTQSITLLGRSCTRTSSRIRRVYK